MRSEAFHSSGTRSKLGGKFENFSGTTTVFDLSRGAIACSKGLVEAVGVGDEVGEEVTLDEGVGETLIEGEGENEGETEGETEGEGVELFDGEGEGVGVGNFPPPPRSGIGTLRAGLEKSPKQRLMTRKTT